jgi:ribonuclease HI
MTAGSTGTQTTERTWDVTIKTEVQGRDGSWSAEALLKEGDTVIKTISLSGKREGGTSWDDLLMRAAIDAVVEVRLASDNPITFHSSNNYLHEGFAWFQARYEAGGRKRDGNRVKNWERWKQLSVLTRGVEVSFQYPPEEARQPNPWDDFDETNW